MLRCSHRLRRPQLATPRRRRLLRPRLDGNDTILHNARHVLGGGDGGRAGGCAPQAMEVELVAMPRIAGGSAPHDRWHIGLHDEKVKGFVNPQKMVGYLCRGRRCRNDGWDAEA